MIMKREIFYCTAFICLFASCLDKDKFALPDDKGDEGEKLDLSFDFSMKSAKELTITVESTNDAGKAEIPFYVYLDTPYTEEGDHRMDILPIYDGKTNQNGILKTTLTIPNIATHLYIYTPYSTFGGMQVCEIKNSINATFRSIYMTEGRAVKARAGENVFTGTRPAKSINQATNLHSYYTFDLNKEFASFGMFKDKNSQDPEIIEAGSESTLVLSEKKWAYTYFPEGKTVDDDKYFGPDYCTDLIVEKPSTAIDGTFEGAHVWVTFIGDGKFSIKNNAVVNSLCYYTYTGTLSESDAAKIHKTLIYPSTNEAKLTNASSSVIGSRIQLLYWDGQKYVDTFPEGVKIGWAMVSNGTSELKHLGDINNFRFSTPILNSAIGNNPGNYTNGIARWCEEAQMNLVGMENRQHLDPSPSNDMDYNDILFKVDSDPIIKPIDEIPPVNIDEETHNITGTLAFEDNWPLKGDYDFNDFVTGYTYSLVRDKGESMVKSIRMKFTPRALGATYNSGFAIQLPIDAGNVKEVKGGGTLENKNGNAVILVYEDTRRNGFDGKGGYINTEKGSNHVEGTPVTINVVLQNKINLETFDKFNPFIYVGNRSHEIHLTDMIPTDKMDSSLLGSKDDKSDAKQGVFYRTDNTHPWALDIPSPTNSTTAVWGYPIEGATISSAYPNYNNWTSDHDINWLSPQKAEYVYP